MYGDGVYADASAGGAKSFFTNMAQPSGLMPPTPPSHSADMSQLNNSSTTAVAVAPGPSADAQPSSREAAEECVNSSYGYFLDRGNGVVTRLVPADMLPPGFDMQHVPRIQQFVVDSRMITLPVLKGPGPMVGWEGRATLQPEQVSKVSCLPLTAVSLVPRAQPCHVQTRHHKHHPGGQSQAIQVSAPFSHLGHKYTWR
jgi:hypothetical protein